MIDTKACQEEEKINSAEEDSVHISVKKVKSFGGANVFVVSINGNKIAMDSNDQP